MPGFFDAPRPRLFAHRGDSLRYPENTMPAFQAAVDAGVRYIETDLHCTADGVVVISHDPTTGRLTGTPGHIRQMPFGDLRALDAGYAFSPDDGRTFPFRGARIRYATLEQLLTGFPEIYVNMDIKAAAPGDESRVADVIRSARAETRVCVASFHDAILQNFRAAAPDIPTSLAMQETLDFVRRFNQNTWDGYAAPGRALQIPPRYGGQDVITPEFLAAAERAGVEIHIWTINEEADARALLARGAHGIMSDDPRLLMKLADSP